MKFSNKIDHVNFISQELRYVIKDEQYIGISSKSLKKILVDLHSFDQQYIKLKLLV